MVHLVFIAKRKAFTEKETVCETILMNTQQNADCHLQIQAVNVFTLAQTFDTRQEHYYVSLVSIPVMASRSLSALSCVVLCPSI